MDLGSFRVERPALKSMPVLAGTASDSDSVLASNTSVPHAQLVVVKNKRPTRYSNDTVNFPGSNEPRLRRPCPYFKRVSTIVLRGLGSGAQQEATTESLVNRMV